MIDVDGSHLYKKHQQLAVSGVTVAPLTHPSPPLSGWKSVIETSVKTLAKEVPRVTSGNLFVYYIKHTLHFMTKMSLVFQFTYRFGVHLPSWSRGSL